MGNKYKILLIILLSITILSISVTYSNQEVRDIETNSTYIVDNPDTETIITIEKDSNGWPNPVVFALHELGYIYNANDDSGIDKDIAEELAKRIGFEIDFILKDRVAIWKGLESGNVMITGNGIQSSDRDRFSWFVMYMAQKNFVVKLKSLSEETIDEFITNKDLKWGAVNSFNHGEYEDDFLDTLLSYDRVNYTGNQDQLFRMLKNNRHDAIFALPVSYKKYLAENEMEDLVIIEDWLTETKPIPHGLVLSKKIFNEQQLKIIQEVVEEMIIDGTLEEIFSKYIGEDSEYLMLEEQY